jgi:hypothetical protein
MQELASLGGEQSVYAIGIGFTPLERSSSALTSQYQYPNSLSVMVVVDRGRLKKYRYCIRLLGK